MEIDRVIIHSPHYDDAYLSLGGLIAKQGLSITIIIYFGVSNHVFEKEIEDVRLATYIRKQEEEKNAERFGVNLKIYDLKEALIRGYYRNKQLINTYPKDIDWKIDSKTYKFIKKRLMEEENSVLHLCPLGIGDHVDHKILRTAFVEYMKISPYICFYEDLPYAYNFNKITYIEDLAAEYEYLDIDIQQQWDMKLESMQTYKSQIRGTWIKNIKEYCENISTEKECCERIYCKGREIDEIKNILS